MAEARKHGSYIVFKNENGETVRKYPNVLIVKEAESDEDMEKDIVD